MQNKMEGVVGAKTEIVLQPNFAYSVLRRAGPTEAACAHGVLWQTSLWYQQILGQTRLELLQSPRIPQSREQRGWAQNTCRGCLSRIKSMCRSNWIWARFEDEDGLMVDRVIQRLKTRLSNYCFVLSVGSMAKEDRVWWSVRRSSQHGEISESSKNQNYTCGKFSNNYNQREQQKTKIHTWKIFKYVYALPNRKEPKIQFRKTMHFRHHTSESSTTFSTPAAKFRK